jgi:hypothetical protein
MFVRIGEPAQAWAMLGLALTTTTTGEIVMATPSYRERMKAARAAASAQRKAEQEAYRRYLELRTTTERLARQLVIDGIRARGEKVTKLLVQGDHGDGR